MFSQPITINTPTSATSCAVFSAAHSGSSLLAEFVNLSDLTVAELRSSEDAFVNRLIESAPECGAPLIYANFSRAYVDANRAPSELDPALISGLPRQKTNPRVAVGLGVLPRVVAGGRTIQRGKIDLAEAKKRMDTCYYPFHTALAQLITDQRQKFDICLLFDFHSMPREALNSSPLVNGRVPDIVLGDRFGTSCDRWVIDEVHTAFSNAGLTVARNAPFAGGYITQHYGRPNRHVHAIQIEINRALYMNENRIEPSDRFDEIQLLIGQVIGSLCLLGPAQHKFAAE